MDTPEGRNHPGHPEDRSHRDRLEDCPEDRSHRDRLEDCPGDRSRPGHRDRLEDCPGDRSRPGHRDRLEDCPGDRSRPGRREDHSHQDRRGDRNRRLEPGGGRVRSSSSLLPFSRSLASARESRTKALVPLLRIYFCRYLVPALVCGLLSACGKRHAADNPAAPDVYVRGDRVVAEQSAAQFFEGRVLSVQGDRLRLQAIGGSDSLTVVASDVYRLPPSAHELATNQLAICGHGEAWQPCRVVKISGNALKARAASGEVFELTRDRLLVPSALTELNLKRYFARSEAEQAFAHAADRAGDPRPEPGWRPALRERLLVKVGAAWFTGYVREIDSETAEIALSSPQRSTTVPLSALSAEPPSSFVSELRRGDFVLLRPSTPSEPWARMQVRALNDAELKLGDASGTLKSATVREVVPLRP